MSDKAICTSNGLPNGNLQPPELTTHLFSWQCSLMKIPLFFLSLVFIGSSAFGLEKAFRCENLRAHGAYAKAYLNPLEEELKNAKTQSEQLRIILNAVHGTNRLNANLPDLAKVESVARQFGRRTIEASEKIPGVKEHEHETYREIHNRYSRYGVSKLFFGPIAEDVIRFKIAFGCSHYSRAILALIRSSGIIPADEVKYVVAVSTADQLKVCTVNAEEDMANGHQFLLLKLDGKWNYWNTSSPALELIPTKHQSPRMLLNTVVKFASLHKMPDEGRVVVRAIEGEDTDPICDGTLAELRNIYRSGKASDPICRWTSH